MGHVGDTTGERPAVIGFDARFLGDVALVEIAVQGLDQPILARVKESDVPPPGSEVGVGIDSGAVLVFEADNGERLGA